MKITVTNIQRDYLCHKLLDVACASSSPYETPNNNQLSQEKFAKQAEKKYSKATYSLLPVRKLLISVFPLLATVQGPKQETLSRTDKSSLDSISSELLKPMSLLRHHSSFPSACEQDSPCVPLSSIDPRLMSVSKTAWSRAERSVLL